MEGLLPMVYRAIKKHKTRRQYKCLSSSGRDLGYNIMSMAQFYPQAQGYDNNYQEPSIQNVVADQTENFGHRRYNSTGDFYDRFSSPHQMTRAAGGPADSKQLVRHRSHKLFSCVTG